MTADSRDDWIEERAAVLEFDGGYPRDIAERLAREQWARWQEQQRAQAAARQAAGGVA